MPTSARTPPASSTPASAASASINDRRVRHEAEAAATLREVIAVCSAQRMPFVDPEFPPSSRSLYLDGVGWRGGNQHRSQQLRSLTWLRPAEITFPDARRISVGSGRDLFDAGTGLLGSLFGAPSARGEDIASEELYDPLLSRKRYDRETAL